MRFFARITFILNICFLGFAGFRYYRFLTDAGNTAKKLEPLAAIEGSIVVLGVIAIFVNFAFCVLALLRLKKVKTVVSNWLLWSNVVFLPLEFIYFFILD